ncbi:hypothetical protein KEM48_014338 [Puccinia striiformis f. sp. tritici PST-130]|nr:hypothetical protein KEM48_014338 [Puccinia striiformis f. sp. tritici PST-130]
MGAHLRMEKISPPSNNNGTLNTNQSSLSAQLPLNAFAELKSSLLPLPESGRTYSPQGPIDFNQGVSPKDINQYTTSLALASSRSTPVPTHVERLCQDRPPVLQPALMPIPTEENCGERLTTALAPSENHQEHQVLSTGEEPYIPPSAIATTMLDQQWTLPASTTVKERPSDEDSFTTSHLNPGTPLEPSRTRGDAPHQLTMDSARRTSPPKESIQNNATQHTPTPAQTQTVPMVMSIPVLPGMNQTHTTRGPVPNMINLARRPTPEITYLVVPTR